MIAATALFLPAVASPASAEDAEIARGSVIGEADCSRNHLVNQVYVGKHPEISAFRTFRERYRIDDAEEAIAEGIPLGHADMPGFIARPDRSPPSSPHQLASGLTGGKPRNQNHD